MKILLSNYRYFLSGGPERYLFAINSILTQKGHQITPFSIKSKLNYYTPWEKYFISPIGDDSSIYFSQYKQNLKTLFKVIERSFYSPEVYKKTLRIIDKSKPDIAFILHFLNKMSPSIINALRKRGVPVVVRLSDFGILCPEGHFLYSGNICEDCIHGDFYHSVLKKCIKNSYIGSFIKCISWYFHRLTDIYDKVDKFLCPSQFTKNKLIEAGFPNDKLVLLQTFIDTNNIQPLHTNGEYLLYFGRLSMEKGPQILLNEYVKLPYPKPPLYIIADDMQKKFHQFQEIDDNIRFIPFQSSKDILFNYIKNAKIVIVPSICYENLPNAILESYANGKPVIASNMGSIPGIVKDGETGLLFDPYKEGDLRSKINYILNNPEKLRVFGANAYNFVRKYFSPEIHYSKLINIFNQCCNK